MILDSKDRIFPMNHPLNGPIIEIYVTDNAFGFDRCRIDREIMILRGYLHMTRFDSPDRMVGPMMAECQFEGLPAKSQP